MPSSVCWPSKRCGCESVQILSCSLADISLSVYNSIQIRYILQRDLAIGQHDYGMFSEALVYEYSLVTRVLYRHLLSVQTVGIWQLQVGSYFIKHNLS